MAMEGVSTSLCQEGYSMIRSPFFNRDNYSYWKNRMKLFIQSNDYTYWDVNPHINSVLTRPIWLTFIFYFLFSFSFLVYFIFLFIIFFFCIFISVPRKEKKKFPLGLLYYTTSQTVRPGTRAHDFQFDLTSIPLRVYMCLFHFYF